MTGWTDGDSRALTVALVAYDGHRIHLVGEERAEAVRIMARRGLDAETIADRLRVRLDSLRQWANNHGIDLTPAKEPQPWWVAVACPSSSGEARRRQKRDRAARLAAGGVR